MTTELLEQLSLGLADGLKQTVYSLAPAWKGHEPEIIHAVALNLLTNDQRPERL